MKEPLPGSYKFRDDKDYGESRQNKENMSQVWFDINTTNRSTKIEAKKYSKYCDDIESSC